MSERDLLTLARMGNTELAQVYHWASSLLSRGDFSDYSEDDLRAYTGFVSYERLFRYLVTLRRVRMG